MTNLNIIKVTFCYVLVCSIDVYNLILFKSSIKIISHKNLHLTCTESLSSCTDVRLEITRKATNFKGYLRYKTITPQKMFSGAQFKNFHFFVEK